MFVQFFYIILYFNIEIFFHNIEINILRNYTLSNICHGSTFLQQVNIVKCCSIITFEIYCNNICAISKCIFYKSASNLDFKCTTLIINILQYGINFTK